MSLEQDLKSLRDERQKRFNIEDWEGALEVHDKILDLSPSPLRYANRGSILYRLGRIEEAIDAYRKALDLDPSLRRAKADLERLEKQLAEQEQEQQQQKEADLPLPDQKSDISESQQESLNQLRDERQLCLQNEDWEGALDKHNQILKIEPSALRYANKGSILYRLKRLSEAKEAYCQALELDPSMSKAKIDLERLEAQMEEEGLLGSSSEGEKDVYEKIERFRKERQEKVEQGLWKEALNIHDQVLELEPTALRHANRGALLYRLGQHKNAIKSYCTALEIDPSLEQAKEAIAHLEGLLDEESLLSAEDNALSQEELSKQISVLKDERQIHIKEKNWDKALVAHDKIIDLEPTALRYVNRGAMLYRMKNLQGAIDAHYKALELDSSLKNAKKDIERMERELKRKNSQQPEISQEDIEKKIEELKTKRQEKIEENQWEDALEFQNEIIALEPNALRYTNKGSMLYRLGDVKEAILCYKEALALDPELERAKSDLERLKENEMDRLREERQVKMEENNWKEALDVHDTILALETTALRMANRGSIQYRMGRFQDAINSYKEALRLDPDLEKAKEDLEQLEEELAENQELVVIPKEFIEDDEEEFFNAIPVDENEDIINSEKKEEIKEEVVTTSWFLKELSGHQGIINDFKLIENTDLLLSASKDKTVKIWNIETNECIRTLEGHDDWVRFLTTNPDNTRLFSCGDDWNVRAWNIETGQCEHILEGHTMPVLHLSTSPSHRFLFSSSRDRTIKIWDYQSGKLLSTLEGHKDWVNNFISTPDGNKAISSSLDGNICIWNVLGWRCTNTLKGHKGWINFLFITNDGKKIISGSSDCTIKIWNFSEGEEEKSINTNSNVIEMLITEDEAKVVALTEDNVIRIWEIETGKCLKTIRNQTSTIKTITLFDKDQNVFCSCVNGDVIVWNIDSGKKITQFNDGIIANKLITISNKNWIVGAGDDASIKIWDTSKCI